MYIAENRIGSSDFGAGAVITLPAVRYRIVTPTRNARSN